MALTVSVYAGIEESTHHNKMFRRIKALRFFFSIFKPLCGRKTPGKPRFHPIKPCKILWRELEFMPILLLGKTPF
jgi:hypothetical protein